MSDPGPTVFNGRYELHRQPRARRHGRGLPRPRPAARPPVADEGAVPGVRHRPGLRRAVPAGGHRGRQPQPPQHRRRVRLGRGRRHLLHRHGVRRRPHALGHPPRRGPAPPRPGGRRRRRRGRRARLRPPQRRRPPRREAGQRARHRRRPGEGRRLRHRPGHHRQRRREPHPGRHRDGHRHLLQPRAGARRRRRPALRHLLPRLRALRAAGGQAALQRRHARRHRLQARAGVAGPAAAAQRRAPRRHRGDRAQVPRQEPGRTGTRRPRTCAPTCVASARAAASSPSR